MSNTNPWEDITIPTQNIKAKLVSSSHPIEIYWAVNQEGQYLLVLEFNNLKNCSINDFPKVNGFNIILTDLDVLVITLNNKEQWGLFYSICKDLITSTRPCDDHTDAVNMLIRRLRSWQIFLSSGKPKILSDEKIRGLIAELIFLESHLFPYFEIDAAIDYWTGPEGSSQDFNIQSTVVEVKSQLGEKPRIVRISSADQLCPELPELYLHVVVLGKSDESITGSFNLIDLIDRIRKDILDSAPLAIERFNELLLKVRYIENSEYQKKNFILLNEKTFEVRDDFPRICPKDIPIGIEQVRYNVNLASCDEFLCELKWENGHAN